MFDFSLFPKNEEWGTGDEALDLRLSLTLKKAQQDLNFQTIRTFLMTGSAIKTRTYNPSFSMLIEMVTKALLHLSSPKENVHDQDPLLKALSENNKTVFIDGLAVLWYDQGQIFTLSLIS